MFGKFLESLTFPGNPRVIALSGIFHTSGISLWGPLFPLFLASQGLGIFAIALVFALGLAAGMLGGPLGGLFADRGGRKRVIVAAATLVAAGGALFASALLVSLTSLPLLAGAYALVTLGTNVGTGASRALLFESVPPEKRGLAMSSPYALPSLVSVPMPFLGGLLGEGGGWWIVFSLSAGLLALSLVTRARFLKEPHVNRQDSGNSRPGNHSPTGRWRVLSLLVAFVVTYGAITFGQKLYGPFLPLYFTQYLGASVGFYGLLASLEMGMVGFLAIVSGKLVDRLGALETASLSLAGETVVVGVLVFVRNLYFAGTLYLLWGSADFLDIVAPSVFIGGSVGRERRATAIGSFGVITSLPALAAPVVGGFLYSTYPPLILIVYAVIVGFASLGTLAILRRIRASSFPTHGRAAGVPPRDRALGREGSP